MEIVTAVEADEWAAEWAALPKLGTRVLVPYPRGPLEGVVISHHRLCGKPLAKVSVLFPVSHNPYETHLVRMTFRPDMMEIIPD